MSTSTSPEQLHELGGRVARLQQVLEAQVRAVADELGITTSQATALRELSEPLTLRSLAARMCCEPSNASYVVERMAAQGLVERRQHPNDRRAKQVLLTEAGQSCRRNVLRALAADSPFGGLDPADRRRLEELLGRVVGTSETAAPSRSERP